MTARPGARVTARRLAVFGALAAVVVGASACSSVEAGSGHLAAGAHLGVTGESAADLYSGAKQAFTSASSVRVAGVVLEDGELTTVNAGFVGSGMSGTITTKGFPISLVFADSVIYFKVPDAFWTSTLGADQAKIILPIVSGKWIKESSASSGYSDLTELADRTRFADSLFDTSTTATGKTGLKTIQNVPCIGVTLSDQQGTLWVAVADGRPVTATPDPGSKDTGELSFSQYGKLPAVTLPPASQTVNGDTFGR